MRGAAPLAEMSNVVAEQCTITEIAADCPTHDTDRAGAPAGVANDEGANGIGRNRAQLDRSCPKLLSEQASDDAAAVVARALRQSPDLIHFGVEPGKLRLDRIKRWSGGNVVRAQHAEQVVNRRPIEDERRRGTG